MAHRGCEHTDTSGWTLVEVVGGFCEVGQGCSGLAEGCPFAWKDGNKKVTNSANRRFAEFIERLMSKT